MLRVSINMGATHHLLLQRRRARHVHVPLPRRGYRAHADGHARQPLCAAAQNRSPRSAPCSGRTPRQSRLRRPSSNWTTRTSATNTFTTTATASTRYDVEFPIQLGSFDGEFHDASETVQPLPFALMRDRLPDAERARLPGHDRTVGAQFAGADHRRTPRVPAESLADHEATAGQRILLRHLEPQRHAVSYTLRSRCRSRCRVVGHRLHGCCAGPAPTGTSHLGSISTTDELGDRSAAVSRTT